MANINNLQLNDEVLPEINPEEMKEQTSGRVDPLYPGDYAFTLPLEFDFETVESQKGQRVAVLFKNDTMLQTPAGPYAGRITNIERVITDRDTGDEYTVSDFGFLLKALGFKGKLKSNKDYVEALLPYAGKTFLATIEWTGYCNPQREIYKDGEKVEGVTGCGARYGQRSYTKKNGEKVGQIPKDDHGRWSERFVCSCEAQAEVSIFPSLQRIRAKK